MSWWRRLLGKSRHDKPAPPQGNSSGWELNEIAARLDVRLPDGWSRHPPPNPETTLLVRDKSRLPGRIEISFTGYKVSRACSGELPGSKPEELEEQACLFGRKAGGEMLVRKTSGKSACGSWGSAVFDGGAANTGRGLERGNVAHLQQWFLINRQHDLVSIMSVTHVCFEMPDPEEIVEAEQIVLGLTVHKDPASPNPTQHSASNGGQPIQAARLHETLPEAPDGYSWELAGQSQAYFLRPRHWHFKIWEKDGALSYFITQEPIPADAKPGSFQFETGVSVNVLRGVNRVKGITPSATAAAYVQMVTESADHVTENTWQNQGGPFIGLGVQFRSGSDIGQLRQQHFLIANDTTDTLYLIIFECPARSWDRVWPTANVIIERLMLHPDV